jgi:hypothetical protein
MGTVRILEAQMKKIILIFSIIIVAVALASCSKGEVPKEENVDLGKTNSEVDASSPLKTVNEVKDAYGNILQQVMYNTITGDMYIYDYTYKFDGTAFYCTGSWMTLVEKEASTPPTVEISTPNIEIEHGYYYNFPIEARLLLDSGDIKVSLVGYEYDGTMGEHLFKFEAKNTGDRPVVIHTDNEIINGVNHTDKFIRMDETLFSNETAILVLCITNDDLDALGIKSINSLLFDLVVCDTQDYGKKIKSTPVTIIDLKH